MRLGIIGMGYMGRTHYEAARKIPGAEVAAIADSNAKALSGHPGVHACTDVKELLADENVEAVVIAVPTFQHESCVLAAAAAKKHILCEKPFSLTAESSRRMMDAARANDVALMIAHPLRFWPGYTALRDAVREGLIGEVRSASGWRLSAMPGWSDWFRDPARSGGCLLDLHIHDLDFIYWLLGVPRQVFTAGPGANGAGGHVFTTLQYENAVVTLEAAYDMPASWPFATGLRVNGTKAAIEYRFAVAGNVQERDEASNRLVLFPEDSAARELPLASEDAYVEQLRYFIDAAGRGEQLSRCPVEGSLAAMRIYEACLRSVREGRPTTPVVDSEFVWQQ